MNYRDDVVAVITVGDGTKSNLKMTLDDRLSTRDRLTGSNKDNLSENMRLSDEVADQTIITLSDDVGVSDEIFDKKISRQMAVESIAITDNIIRVYRDECMEVLRVSDSLKQTLRAKILINDGVMVQDNNHHIIKDTISDEAKTTDRTNTERKLGDILSDIIRTHDRLYFGVSDEMAERLTAKDTHQDKQRGKNTLDDRLMVSDGVVEAFKKTSLLDDVVKVGDEVFDKLIAKNLLTERAMVAVIDEVVQDMPNMAWTMNTVNQAISQYTPYDVQRVVVVNGVLYGECKDGVYRLDGSDETITGIIITDKVDYGENLVKPAYAYTEYRTDGTIKLTVHTTQKGVEQKYTYALPKERAGELTNGRFVFGRGLYGRHFAYVLAITARTAFIHDLNIHFKTTNRRL